MTRRKSMEAAMIMKMLGRNTRSEKETAASAGMSERNSTSRPRQ